MRKLFIFSMLFFSIVTIASAKIVWMSDWEIFVMEDDGSKRQRLTYNKVYDGTPRWSPNGKFIAFDRAQERVTNEQNHDLFIMNRDGTQERQLTAYSGLDVNPSWSSDGQYLSFTSTRGEATNIYIIDIETQVVRELRRNMNGHTSGQSAWSPDGKQIAYVSVQRNPYEESIYIVDTEGQNRRLFVVPVKALLYSIRWSPDGKQILYGEKKYGNNNDIISDKIVIRTLDGLLVKELEMPSLAKWSISTACWMGMHHVLIYATEDYKAPDGGQSDIYRYTITTDEIVNLTNSPRDNDTFPDWIDDKALDVVPVGKLTIRWAELKQTN